MTVNSKYISSMDMYDKEAPFKEVYDSEHMLCSGCVADAATE
jgi:hypothetical protein